MNENIIKVLEWAVWANLDKVKNIELLLLKGHLILETVMSIALENAEIIDYKSLSFFKKAKLLKEISKSCPQQTENVIEDLLAFNKIRNQLAHEWNFSVSESNLENWAIDILGGYDGLKFSNYTFRTQIVHAFSRLSVAILKI